MKLVDLQPEFIKLESEGSWRTIGSVLVVDADGLMFKCPKCFIENKGPIGTHSVICWKPHVPLTIHPRPGRWRFEGTTFYDLSLKADSSSILLLGGCSAHFYVTDGEIRMT